MANDKRPSNSIIQICVMKSDSLVACTCGGLYCSTEPLPMGFTVPHTRLVHDHLRPLSFQRIWSPATLTTWTSLLYVSLIDSLEYHNATLLEFLSHYTHNFIIKGVSPWNSYTIHILSQNIIISCQKYEIQSQMPNSYMHNIIHHT